MPRPPLGLILIASEGGAQGVESRWQMVAAPSGSSLMENRSAWVMRRLRARIAPPAEWRLLGDDTGQISAEPPVTVPQVTVPPSLCRHHCAASHCPQSLPTVTST